MHATQGVKRALPESAAQGQPPAKRARRGAKPAAHEDPPLQPKAPEDPPLHLNGDALNTILSFLPYRDVLAFELAAKAHVKYTSHRWTVLAKREGLEFAFCEVYPQKYNFILAKALGTYITIRQTLTDNDLRIQSIYNRFEPLMIRYPCFGAYVWTDLSQVGEIKSNCIDIFKKSEESLNQTEGRGGEHLLKALVKSSLAKKPVTATFEANLQSGQVLGSLHEAFLKAILKGATAASALAIRVLIKKFDQRDFYFSLASLSSAHHDFRGLEEFFIVYPQEARILYSSGIHYPPVLFGMAAIQADYQLKEKEKYLLEALEKYESPPLAVWIAYAKLQSRLNQPKKEEMAWNQAIACYEQISEVPPDVLMEAFKICVKQSKTEQASEHLDRALKAFGKRAPLPVLREARQFNTQLKKWDKVLSINETILFNPDHEAKDLLEMILAKLDSGKDEGIEKDGDQLAAHPECDARGFAWAAYVKTRLQKWTEADKLYDQAEQKGHPKLKGKLLLQKATSRFMAKRWKDAEPLYDELIVSERDKPDFYTNLLPSIKVKMELQKWPEAEKHFDEAMKIQNNPDPHILATGARIKFERNDLDHAESLYQKAIEKFASLNQKVPVGIWRGAGKTQLSKKEWAKAEPYYDQAFAELPPGTPAEFFAEIARIKSELGKWEEAEKFHALERDARIPADSLANSARTKCALGKWAEADDFCKKAIARYPETVPQDLLDLKAQIDRQLSS